MRKSQVLMLFLSVVVLIGLMARPAYPTTNPEAFVKNTFAQARADLKGDTNDTDALRKRVRNLLHIERLSYSVLGPRARQISDRQFKAFQQAFGPFIVNALSEQLQANKGALLGSFDSVKSSVRTLGKQQYAQVKGALSYRDQTIDVELRLLQSNAGWRAYDVRLNSFSLSENYRSQFQNKLTNSSIDDLIKALKAKVESNGGG